MRGGDSDGWVFTMRDFCFVYPVWLTLTVDFAYLNFFFFYPFSLLSNNSLLLFFLHLVLALYVCTSLDLSFVLLCQKLCCKTQQKQKEICASKGT